MAVPARFYTSALPINSHQGMEFDVSLLRVFSKIITSFSEEIV